MSYTVNQLATLSGISVRTLHFYDEIGLLKPAYYGKNHYRYYEEEELLLLQQILFFRELGFQLNDIKKIVLSSDFDKITALESHKMHLEKNLDQTQNLIKTINKTLEHLRGNTKMRHEDMYYGFDSEKQKNYEKELVKKGIVTQAFMDQCKEKMQYNKEENWNKFKEESEEIHLGLVNALNQKLEPTSPIVQDLIRRHHHWVGWEPTKEKYIALSQLYQTPEFQVFFKAFHPELLDFIVSAMKIFAENELS